MKRKIGAWYHSITFKDLVIFLVIFLVALIPLVVSYIQASKRGRIDHLAAQLELVATQAERGINLQTLGDLADPTMTGSPMHRQLVDVLAGIQQNYKVDNAILMRRELDGSFFYIADGNNQFYVYEPVRIHKRFPETYRAAAQAWDQRDAFHTELFGFGEIEYLQVYHPIEYQGKVVAQVLINKIAEDVDQAIRTDAIFVIALTTGLFLLGSAVFWILSSRMLMPVRKLRLAALQIAQGDLEPDLVVTRGRDEAAQLNRTFIRMVRELRESRESLNNKNEELTRALSRVRLMEDLEASMTKFLPREVGKALRQDPQALERGKVEQDVTVAFLDIEDSTNLTRRLDASGVDILIQNYFSHYLDAIYDNNGDITETAGDGLMIIFQQEQHALDAVKNAVAIQEITRQILLEPDHVNDNIQINIGINSGSALVGFTKFEAVSGTRVTFTATGMTTILAARLADKATQGRVLISQETLDRVEKSPEFSRLEVQVESLGPVKFKNFDSRECVYALTGSAPTLPAAVGE